MKNIQYTLDLTRDYYNLLSQEDVLEQKKQRFMWDGNVAGMEEDGVDSYYLQDALGSVVNLVGKDGESIEQMAYEEFGQIRNRSVRRTVQPFAFTGYQMDETSRLYFAQARRYDAGAGRFVSEDKVREFADVPVTLNHYGYCWNRPEDLVDLDGKFVMTTILIAAGIGALASLTTSLINEARDANEGINVKNVVIDTFCGAAAGVLIGTGVGIGGLIAGGAGIGAVNYVSKTSANSGWKKQSIKSHILYGTESMGSWSIGTASGGTMAKDVGLFETLETMRIHDGFMYSIGKNKIWEGALEFDKENFIEQMLSTLKGSVITTSIATVLSYLFDNILDYPHFFEYEGSEKK